MLVNFKVTKHTSQKFTQTRVHFCSVHVCLSSSSFCSPSHSRHQTRTTYLCKAHSSSICSAQKSNCKLITSILSQTRGCGRWEAARYGAILAVEYGQTEGTAVASVTRSPGARRRGFLMTPAKYVTYIHESTNHHLEILIIRPTLTQLLCPVTLTFDPLTLKLVHGVLVSRGPLLPSLVFVGLFVFPLGGGTGQTDSIDT